MRQTLNGEGPQGDMEMLHNETDRLEAEVGGKGFGVLTTDSEEVIPIFHNEETGARVTKFKVIQLPIRRVQH